MFHVFWRQEADVNGNVNGKKKRRKRIIIISVVVAAILLCVGVVFAFTRGGTKIDPSKLAKVEKGDLAKSVVATGKVEPITKVEVKSKASGIVKKLLVQAGDKVKKGQLLAQLDKEEIQAQVAQSQAALQAAEASLKGSEADYERAKVDAEGPDVPLLKRAYERAIGLATEGVLSASALEDADKNFNGKVTRISPMGVEKDNVTTFEVRVSINNPGGELKAEMTANAEIILEEHKSVLQIPEGAILYDKDKKASVEMPDPKAKDGKKKMAVNIGISNGAKTEVVGGLKEGDQVVLQ